MLLSLFGKNSHLATIVILFGLAAILVPAPGIAGEFMKRLQANPVSQLQLGLFKMEVLLENTRDQTERAVKKWFGNESSYQVQVEYFTESEVILVTYTVRKENEAQDWSCERLLGAVRMLSGFHSTRSLAEMFSPPGKILSDDSRLLLAAATIFRAILPTEDGDIEVCDLQFDR